MKKELHKDYGSVCSTVMGTSEFFFGDLSKLTKNINDANKLTKKIWPPNRLVAETRTELTLTVRMDPLLAGGENKFHPYQYQGNKNSNFSGRSPYPKFKKKKGGKKPQRH